MWLGLQRSSVGSLSLSVTLLSFVFHIFTTHICLKEGLHAKLSGALPEGVILGLKLLYNAEYSLWKKKI